MSARSVAVLKDDAKFCAKDPLTLVSDRRNFQRIHMNSMGVIRAGSIRSFLLLTLVALAVLRVSAQPRFSVNAVGYVDATLYAGSNLMANPLNARDNSVANIFRGIPDGSFFLRWNPATRWFDDTNHFRAGAGWTDPTATVVVPNGGWLWVPRETQISYVGEPWPGMCVTYRAQLSLSSVMPKYTCGFCGSINGECPAMIPDYTTMYLWDAKAQEMQQFVWMTDGWYAWNLELPFSPDIRPGEAAFFDSVSQFSARFISLGGTLSQFTHAHLQPFAFTRTNLTLALPMSSNMIYTVLCSTNLLSNQWQTVQQGVMTPSNSLADVVVPRSTNGSAFYRLLAWPTSTNAVLVHPTRQGTSFSCRLYAPVTATYVLERTAVLTNGAPWTAAGSTTGTASNVITLTDHNATPKQGYYRVRY